MATETSNTVFNKSLVVVMLIILTGLTLGLRLLVVWGAPITGDEAYYWMWSRHLDWAYYDHPAGIALLLRVSTLLNLQGHAGLRWINAVLGLMCIPLVYLIGQRLFSKTAGIYSAVIVGVSAPYILISGIVYTDALHLFFLLLNLWFFSLLLDVKAHNTDVRCLRSLFIFLLWGLSLICLFNTKYSAYLYALGLGVAILLYYRWFIYEWLFWLAVLMGVIGLLPVLVWNATHDWISFSWQLTHLLSFSPGGNVRQTLLMPIRNVWHALGYLTWPVLLAVLPVFSFKNKTTSVPAHFLLIILSIALLSPVILSPADSPRNLITGMTLLMLLAGAKWADWHIQVRGIFLGFIFLMATVYGSGTAAALNGINYLPVSTVVSELRYDTAGMYDLKKTLADYPDPIFTLDYQLAGWLVYDTGRKAYSGWGQYRIWGIPELDRFTIVSLGFLPEACVTNQLNMLFKSISDVRRLEINDGDVTKEVHIWLAAHPFDALDNWVSKLDFLTLWEICG